MTSKQTYTYANTSSPIFYHTLKPHDIQVCRIIRLRALSESPSQFGSTFEREVAFQADRWNERLSNPDQVTFIATNNTSVDALELPPDSDTWNEPSQFKMSDELAYGLIGCIRSFENPSDAFIVSFWVSPNKRGLGIGKTLIEKVLAWAKQHNGQEGRFTNIILDVWKDNWPARSLYEKCGFIAAGESPEDRREIRYTYNPVK